MINPREINLSDHKWLPGEKKVVKGVSAAASADNAAVTYTMLKVLNEGGNAMDAAIAGCILQAAIEPFMTNLTGSVNFLCYHAKEDRYYQLDSSGTFPVDLPAHKPVPKGMGRFAESPPRSIIPGFMPGLKAIYEKFGSKPWSELCAEALWWAENGHHVSSFEFELNLGQEDFLTFFPEGRAFYMPNERFAFVGEKFGSPEMTETIRCVSEEGPDYMIHGAWAQHFIAKGNQMGWNIRPEHMTETPPRWMEPLHFKVDEFELVSLAPPEQQGVYISVVLGVLSKLGIRDVEPYSAKHLFYMAHALRMGQWATGFFNDPEILSFDVNTFLDENFHAYLAKLIQGMLPQVDLTHHTMMTTGFGGGVSVYDGMGGGKIPTLRQNSHQKQPAGSCELSIVDAYGNWVQMMNTLQGGGIPGMVVDGVPMVGSHALPNVQSSPMAYYQVKGARQRTITGNTMVLKDGKPILQLGTPGNVHVTVPQVLCNLLFFKMDPYEAVCAPRMLPITEGGSFIIEDRICEKTQQDLLALGLRMNVSNIWDYNMGSYQICYRDPKSGELCTLSDPRRCGIADGLSEE